MEMMKKNADEQVKITQSWAQVAAGAPTPPTSTPTPTEAISLRVEMAVMGHTMSYLKVRRNARLVWLKVVRLRQVGGKERFFKSFPKTPFDPDMAVRHVRFIFVREELAGKSILSYRSLSSMFIWWRFSVGLLAFS